MLSDEEEYYYSKNPTINIQGNGHHSEAKIIAQKKIKTNEHTKWNSKEQFQLKSVIIFFQVWPLLSKDT